MKNLLRAIVSGWVLLNPYCVGKMGDAQSRFEAVAGPEIRRDGRANRVRPRCRRTLHMSLADTEKAAPS